MDREKIQSWRECPFQAGRKYRVLRSFTCFRGTFTSGEVLEFRFDAWSRIHAVTGYFFQEEDKEVLKAWDLSDGERLEQWKDLFEEVPTN
jgi:hypothetical protein